MTALIFHWLTVVQMNNSIYFCLILDILTKYFHLFYIFLFE